MTRLENDWAERLRAQRKKRESRAAGRRLARQEQRERSRKREELELGGDTGDYSREEGAKVPEEDSHNKSTETIIDQKEFDAKEASLFVYVCTHSAEITKGKDIAGSYLVASDTSWKSREELARTAIPLETFAGAIARIQVTTPVQVTILRVFYPR